MEKKNIIFDFFDFCKSVLQINESPKIYLIEDRNWVVERRSFGEYDPQKRSITVYVKNRNTADILRTCAHEMIHHKQNEMGKIKPGAGKTGSPIENQANSMAGIILREYGKMNQLIYESKNKTKL
jgi:hypothetical protein